MNFEVLYWGMIRKAAHRNFLFVLVWRFRLRASDTRPRADGHHQGRSVSIAGNAGNRCSQLASADHVRLNRGLRSLILVCNGRLDLLSSCERRDADIKSGRRGDTSRIVTGQQKSGLLKLRMRLFDNLTYTSMRSLYPRLQFRSTGRRSTTK